MPNDVYDYLRETDAWVGKDLDSQTKFKIRAAEKFGVSITQFEEWMAEFSRRAD